MKAEVELESTLIIKNDPFELPVYRSELVLWSRDFLTIKCEKDPPNWWWRLWQYVFLGFKWVKIGN